MKAVKVVFALAAAALLAGCEIGQLTVPSVHPLVTDKDAFYDAPLVGIWADERGETVCKFFRLGENGYRLIFVDEGASSSLDAHLVRLGDSLFMDTFPSQTASEADTSSPSEGKRLDPLAMALFHYIPGHVFWRIEVKGDSLRMGWLDPEWLSSAIREKKVTVSHETAGEGIYLTTSTAELQAFVQGLPRDAFMEFLQLHRKKPAAQPKARKSAAGSPAGQK